jgi:hypothetical protein
VSAPLLANNWQCELRQLQPNWDGYGASPISEAAIQCVEKFAVVPTSDGGLQLELHRDDYDIEVEISPGGHVVYVGLGR